LKKVLILGKIPPPTGGVTVHVSRLLEFLQVQHVAHAFYSLSNPVSSIFLEARKYKLIHLHSSNPYFRFIFAFYCLLLRKRLIQTYHGNLGRFGFFRNFFDMLSVVITAIPIVINRTSYQRALRLNKGTKLISAYISPFSSDPLPGDLSNLLSRWKAELGYVFCTNASCLKFDHNGTEVYNGSQLIKLFTEMSQLGLIFSDPSGTYVEYWQEKYGEIPQNVFFISREHSFLEVLKISDCFIRATTTDGDSLSIKESLSLGIPVIASNCVDRPEGCSLYSSEDSATLKATIIEFRKKAGSHWKGLDETEKIISLYGNEYLY
jgi:glycosyltransferase involved in cell wall biosynthesis